MHQYKSAKIYFCFAVLLLVAKPFLGFTMFTRLHPPADESIFVKSFTKRKQEYAEDSTFDMGAIVKKLADPIKQFFLRFSYLLNILFPTLFMPGLEITHRFLNDLKLNLAFSKDTDQLSGKLLI